MKKNYLKKIGVILTLMLGLANSSLAQETETTYPFELSTITGDSFEEADVHWYCLTIRGTYIKYDSQESEKNPTSPYPVSDSEEYLWAFTKTEDNRIKVYNKAAGTKTVLGVSNNKVCMTSDYSWGFKDETQYNGFSFSIVDNAQKKINKNGSRNYLELWDGMDNGSVFNAIAKEDIILENKYYRIKSKTTGKYICSEDPGNNIYQELVNEPTTKNTVFYLNHEGRLIGSTAKFIAGGKTANDLGHTFIFKKETYNNEACYTIKPSGSNYLYDHSAKSGRVDVWKNPSTAQGKCYWILEEVQPSTEANMPQLTKEIESYATLCAPMPLTVPEGVNAYTVEVSPTKNGASAILKSINQNTIPAGLPVIIKNNSGNQSCKFKFASSTENDQNLKTALQGVFINTQVSGEYYVLGNKTEHGIGFYKANAGGTLGANKAYLPASALGSDAQHIKSITFSFDSNGDGTTGIGNIEENTKAEEYYDLQGRRVLNPSKGLYITKSGKKVLFP